MMAQVEKLKKLLEALKTFQTTAKSVEKPIIPVKYLYVFF